MDKLEQFNLQYYLQYGLSILSRRRWLFFWSFLSVLCLATGVSFFIPEAYQTSMTILIERDSIINPLTRGLATTSEMQERLRTIRQGILSRPIIEKVIKKLDLDKEVHTPEELDALIKKIQKHLDINIRGSDLFTVSYTGSDPVMVKQLIDTLTTLYIEENISAKRSDTYQAFDFINEQLQIYKKKLEESEKTLREFKEANLKDLQYRTSVTSVTQSEGGSKEVQVNSGPVVGGLLGGGAQNANLAKLEQYQNSLNEVEMSLKPLYTKLETLKKQLAMEDPVIITPSTSASPAISDPAQIRLKELENELATLLTKYKDQHPDVIRVRSEIEEVKKQVRNTRPDKSPTINWSTAQFNPVYQNLSQEISKTELEINTLERRRDDLQKKIEEYNVKVKTIPTIEQEYIRLTRDYKVNEDIYQMLLRRLEEARISKELEVKEKGTTFKIIEPAVVPLKPSSPSQLLVILMGLIGGLGTGLGAIVLTEVTYRPFNDQKEAESYLGVPVLATIPRILTDEDIRWKKRSYRIMAMLCSLYILLTGTAIAWQTFYKNSSYREAIQKNYQNLPGFIQDALEPLRKISSK
ncbi:MAG TPA: GNVR domain-containing protein [Candidatus Limnocylindrales bacterium]|nr:GNVR domain-containing protein [Candidatus Limnocylindrales bacterium]